MTFPSLNQRPIRTPNSEFDWKTIQAKMSLSTMPLSIVRPSPSKSTAATVTETATAAKDYAAVCGTLTFPAFTTNLTQTISIPILGDATVEPNEHFNIHLGKPTNAVIQPSTARIEICKR